MCETSAADAFFSILGFQDASHSNIVLSRLCAVENTTGLVYNNYFSKHPATNVNGVDAPG